jgi:hypothetical protein
VAAAKNTFQVRVLEYHPPGGKQDTVGVLAYCSTTDSLHLVFRELDYIEDEFDREYLQGVTEELARIAFELGPGILFGQLDDTLSNVIRIGFAQDLMTADDEIDLILSSILEQQIMRKR